MRFSKRVKKATSSKSSETTDPNSNMKSTKAKSYRQNKTEKYDENSGEDYKDIFSEILRKKATVKTVSQEVLSNLNHNIGGRSSSLVHYLQQREWGMKTMSRPCLQQSVKTPVHNLISSLHLNRTFSPFERRCTALEWHPHNPNLLVVGSKGGEIVLWNINNIDSDVFLPGIGPGGSIQAMKFLPANPQYVITASIDGTVTQLDMEAKHTQILAETMDSHEFWYCSLDVNPRRNVLVAGDNVGRLLMMTMDGKEILKKKLHGGKIAHAEFSPREDWLLCTSGLDKMCKLWDVRMIKDKNSAIYILPHDKPVNSAYFSLSDGVRLLTTDQDQQLRVYRGPFWQLERTIRQPHRQFRHMTPQKAYWHPHQDTVVVGRYPDKNFPGYSPEEKRTIDVFDVESGEMVKQLWDSAAKGIVSLTKFNHQGDTLAATMGVNVLIWKQREEVEITEQDVLARDDMTREQPQQRKRKKDSNAEKKKDKNVTEAKLKMLTQSQTKQRKR